MNKYYTNPIERLIAYHVCNHSEELNTIASIHDFSDLPVEVIRRDICDLFLSEKTTVSILDSDDNNIEVFEHIGLKINQILNKTVINLDDAINDVIYYLENIEKRNIKLIKQLFSSGELDYLPFSTVAYIGESDWYEYEDSITIPVTVDEYLAYNNIFEQKILPKKVSDEQSFITSSIRNKKYLCEFEPIILERLNIIEDAIKNDYSLEFSYKAPFSSLEKVHIMPLKIGFDATENKYVVITANNIEIRCYNLAFITGNIFTNRKQKLETNPKLLDITDKVWGFEFDKCYKNSKKCAATNVKVIFYDEANVINKVKRDLAFRHPHKLEINESGNLIYEDDIYGEESFINWVMSFGSSARILSPQKLINMILDI